VRSRLFFSDSTRIGTLKFFAEGADGAGMPFPIIAALAGAAIGRATKKTKKKKAVSGYKTKKGKKVKAYLKNA
jgi:hypothetical protein